MGDIPPISNSSTDAAVLARLLTESAQRVQMDLAFNENAPAAFPLCDLLALIQQLQLRAAALSRMVLTEQDARRRATGDYAASCHGPQYRHQREHQC